MASDAFERVLAGYRRRMADEEARMVELRRSKSDMSQHRDGLLLPVGEEVAQLMVDLIVGLGSQRILELGSSYGYSTLFLAEAARRTGGKLVSFELHAEKQAYARERITEAGLSEHVEWRLGDAVALLADEPGPVNFVLMDLWKDLYIPCLERIHPILAENGVILADNMLFPEFSRPEGLAYREAVRALPGMQAVLLPIGQGIDLACRSRRGG